MRILIFSLLLPGLAVAAPTFNAFNEALHLSCEQHKFEMLECNYRTLSPQPQLPIRATYNNAPLLIEKTLYPWPNAVTAVLFLIDTSDPAREKIVEIKQRHIAQILDAAEAHHRIGIAGFDKQLTTVAPIGTPTSDIIPALKSIKAVGQTTELYRNIIKAIDLIKKTEADRKVIFLLSDGLAEDKAYFHEDVIKAARRSAVVINSIGYPRSIALSVSLQTIRRLSEETGGKYIEADGRYDLPSTYLKTAFKNIDHGGRILVQLSNLTPASPSRQQQLSLGFETDPGDLIIPVPFTIPPAKTVNATATEGVTDGVRIIAGKNDSRPVNLWLWYGIPGALIILIIAVLLTLLAIWKRGIKPSTPPGDNRPQYQPYGYLIRQDETATCYPIHRTLWRIGRGKDNELSLEDNSISRKHAELRRNENGSFEIIDLKSMNGIYVNHEKTSRHTLRDDDLLEIGDIFLRFTSCIADHSLEETRVRHNTQARSSD